MKISKPSNPKEPNPDDCCGSGCARCVWDIYADALERYEEQLEAWKRSVVKEQFIIHTVWAWRPRSVPDSVIRSIRNHLNKSDSLD